MNSLESQVAKIQIGNFKHTSSYVFVLAEKAAVGAAELYLVAELPLFNPAAEASCEKICLAIASALKRSYRKPSNENTFENAVAQINEELAKLASLGQTHWVDKLSCVIAVREDENFSIASCGKVAAFLLRNGEFTDISCSAATSHPLKTFENIAYGQLRLGDIIILSTTQLFNYLSADRLRNVLSESSFLAAAQNVIEILKDSAGPDVAFGTVLNLQVPVGETLDEQIDLEAYVTEKPPLRQSPFERVIAYVKTTFALDRAKRTPAVALPKRNLKEKLAHFTGAAKTILGKSGTTLATAGLKTYTTSKKNLNVENFKGFSRQKKFFFISIVVLLAALVLNIVITAKVKNSRQKQQQITATLLDLQSQVTKAQSLLLFKDFAGAKAAIAGVQDKLPKEADLNKTQKDQYQRIIATVSDVKKGLERTMEVQVTNLGTLGQSSTLLNLPPYIASPSSSTIVSFDEGSGAVQDGALLSSEPIIESAFIKEGVAVVYNQTGLLVWNYLKKSFSPAFSQSVPAPADEAGLAFYPTNNRVYLINKSTAQIISFAVSDKLAKPVIASKDNQGLADALDMAIDGSIFVLTPDGVVKYQSGSVADFRLPDLFTPFSGKGKIFTDKNTKNIYVLDAGNNRVIVIDKRGNLVATLVSNQFTKLKDFVVDEKNKTIYLLNDGTLLKINF